MSSLVVALVFLWQDRSVKRTVERNSPRSLRALIREAIPVGLPAAWTVRCGDTPVDPDLPLSELLVKLGNPSPVVLEILEGPAAVHAVLPHLKRPLPPEPEDSEFELALESDTGSDEALAGADSEFALSLDSSDSGTALSEEAGALDHSLLDFEVPAVEDEDSSQVLALDEAEHSDLDLADPAGGPKPKLVEESVAIEDEDLEEEVAAPAMADADFEEDEAMDSEAPPPARSVVRPASAKKSSTLTDRHATVRYYSQMNPHRVYPLIVVLSKKEIDEVRKQHVRQVSSGPLRLDTQAPLVIEPLLPGFACHPLREQIRVGRDDVTVTFWVVPQVLGRVEGARVVLRQGDEVLTSLPLQIKVVNTSLTTAMGAASFGLPFFSSVLKHYKVDFESQLELGFGSYLGAIRWLLLALPPELLLLLLLAATGVSYLWLRPRRRDVFWDIEQSNPKPEAAVPGRLAASVQFAGKVTAVGAVVGGAVALALLGAAALRFPFEEAARKMAFVLWFLPALGAVGGFLAGGVAGLFREAPDTE